MSKCHLPIISLYTFYHNVSEQVKTFLLFDYFTLHLQHLKNEQIKLLIVNLKDSFCSPLLISEANYTVNLDIGVIKMNKEQLEAKLLELKSDYIRIQGDMDKLEAVEGRVSSAEEQLIRLEKEIAEVNKQLEELE